MAAKDKPKFGKSDASSSESEEPESSSESTTDDEDNPLAAWAKRRKGK